MKEDLMLRGLLLHGEARLIAIDGGNMAEEARNVHGLSRVCTAALGRTLLATAMISAYLKTDEGRVTCIINGGGPAGNIVCTGDSRGHVKGYIENPGTELPPTAMGKLDVSGAVGKTGRLTVVRDLSMKEPYVGAASLVTGEIAEDFAQYFTVSEQQPSLVYLGVRVDAQSGRVRSAGGVIVQPMPGCTEETLAALELMAPGIETLAGRLETAGLHEALAAVFGGMEFETAGSLKPGFFCDCSRERLEKVLISLGKAELEDMIEKDGGAKLTCHFCNKCYDFSAGELKALLHEAEEGA